ncbi:hypothetical protein CAT723_23140 [Corynebacterium ammoniagenes]|uniref:Uncharacterized protein n=1 Tax=Corynebacterium ammoniagenes TaxID=1697 RepID=A0AAV5GC10_CORAM|nr:hypothetical protein CAT723_23140 [Corynebacterium ammoniagenes]
MLLPSDCEEPRTQLNISVEPESGEGRHEKRTPEGVLNLLSSHHTLKKYVEDKGRLMLRER